MDTLQAILAEQWDWNAIWQALSAWLITRGVVVLVIAFLASLALRAVTIGLDRFEDRIQQAALDSGNPAEVEHAKRTKTLSDMLQNVLRLAIFTVAGLTILQELDVNVMPILTGAGIVGLAVGFGAQTLVKDFISGFFLIMENQVRVGDVVQINGTGGLVEEINLRTVVLRDQSGAVHIFPCGSVTTLSNLAKDYAYALLDIDVAYKHDTDDVVKVIERTADELRRSTTFGGFTLEPLEVIGVERFADSAVTIRVRIKTLPLKQFDVRREFQRRLKKAFDASGIEIPFPQRDVTIRHLYPQGRPAGESDANQ